MLELYFIFYRVPKMMTRLAREQGRSALGWSLLGISIWIGTEAVVIFGIGLLYGVGAVLFGWSMPVPEAIKIIAYVAALAAALLSVTILHRILNRKPRAESFISPPPPPDFRSETNRVV